ncbi:MAG TPA: hypothetical protein VGQ29_14500 [Gemmatimonadales bacterium]|jgi:hypothetical protein|nr:hypothetical protein [Gemmatimonadales bacterium]
MNWRIALGLLLVAGPLAAQNGGSPRLAGRVPAAALPAIDSIIATAVAESLPTEPLVQKALEGSAKSIPIDRLVSGVRRAMLQLRAARVIVARAVPGQSPPDGHVAAVGAALARGLPAPIVERLLTVAPNEAPGPALHAAADLIAHHFDPDSAAALLVEAHNKGLRGVRLLDVALAADHELQRRGGRTPSEALARVRAMLPNVPSPSEAAVTRRGTKGS